MGFGKNLRKLREEREISKQEMLEKFRFGGRTQYEDRVFLNKIEAEEREPSPKLKQDIADFFEVDLAELEGKDAEPVQKKNYQDKPNNVIYFTKQLNKLCKATDLSKAEIARTLGIAESTFYNYLSENYPSLPVKPAFQAICELFDVKPDYFQLPEDESIALSFVEDNIYFDQSNEECFLVGATFYEVYVQYCKDNDLPCLARRKFTWLLKGIYGIDTGNKYINSATAHCYLGMGFKDSADYSYLQLYNDLKPQSQQKRDVTESETVQSDTQETAESTDQVDQIKELVNKRFDQLENVMDLKIKDMQSVLLKKIEDTKVNGELTELTNVVHGLNEKKSRSFLSSFFSIF